MYPISAVKNRIDILTILRGHFFMCFHFGTVWRRSSRAIVDRFNCNRIAFRCKSAFITDFYRRANTRACHTHSLCTSRCGKLLCSVTRVILVVSANELPPTHINSGGNTRRPQDRNRRKKQKQFDQNPLYRWDSPTLPPPPPPPLLSNTRGVFD